MQRILWLALAVGLLLVACNDTPASDAPSSTGPGLFFPTKPVQDTASMTALYQGPLIVRDGCVLIGSSAAYTVPIWPKGFTADRDDAGRLVVRDGEGAVVAIEGEPFEMGGGYVAEFSPEDKVDPREDQLRRVEESLRYSIPERCLGPDVYGVWSVGET